MSNKSVTVPEFSLVDHLLANWLPYPRNIVIEPINICQLKCPLCPTGLQKLNYQSMTMTLETFKTIISKVPFVRSIDLHRAGEPFLNPDLLSMVRHASERSIHVVISTNFSFFKPDSFFEEIVNSGLGRLIVSLDGASRESYSKYRIGGDFDQVMANIRKLVEARNKIGSGKPAIVWQFLVNRFNEHEIDRAREMSDQLKITLDLRPLDVSDNLVDVELDTTVEERKAYWLNKDSKYVCDHYRGEVRYPVFQGICPELFASLAVTVDGKILPCCGAWDKSSVFGDLMAESFRDIWSNPKYVNSRKRFFKRDFRPDVQTICFRCNVFGTSPSLKDKLGLLKIVCRKNLRHWERKLSVFR